MANEHHKGTTQWTARREHCAEKLEVVSQWKGMEWKLNSDIMKNTIKYKIIQQAVSHGKIFSRQEFINSVWIAREEPNRRDNTYGNALQEYIREGLIEKVARNKYMAGDLAQTYLDDPKTHRAIIKERRQEKKTDSLAESLVSAMIQQVVWLNPYDTPYDWSGRPVVLVLSNGMCIMPQRDDEGNDAGALRVCDWKTIDEIGIIGKS